MRERIKVIVLFCIVIVLGGCVTIQQTVNGVLEEHWNVMSEPERKIALRRYQEKETLEHRSRLRKARRGGDQRHCFNNEIRVLIKGGKILMHGKHYKYDSVEFNLSCGEKRTITFTEKGSDRYALVRNVEVDVEYVDGFFMFDTRVERFAWQVGESSEWRRGQVYKDVRLNEGSWSEARGIKIFIAHLRYFIPGMHMG